MVVVAESFDPPLPLNLDLEILTKFSSLELMPASLLPISPPLLVAVAVLSSSFFSSIEILSVAGNKRDMTKSELHGRVYAVSVVVNIMIVLLLSLLAR